MSSPEFARAGARLLATSAPSDWGQLVNRLGAALRDPLTLGDGLPAGLLEAVVAGGNPALLAALASRLPGQILSPGLVRSLLAHGQPEVGQVMLEFRRREQRRLLRMTLAAASPDRPGWTGRDGVVTRLLVDDNPAWCGRRWCARSPTWSGTRSPASAAT